MIHVRSVYPRRRIAAFDAIDAYNTLLIAAFNRVDGIAAATCEPDAMWGARCDALLIQYNPFSYGRWGVAPSLVVRLAAARLRRPRVRVFLVVHEPYVAIAGVKTILMAAWHRVQLFALTCLVHSVVVPSSDAARRIGSFPHPPVVVPVGSNLPDRQDRRDEARGSLEVGPGDVVIVVFGASAAGRSMAHVAAGLRAAVERAPSVSLLVLGTGHELPSVVDGVAVHRPGALPADDVARLMAAGDLFLSAYDDGVSTRRGALMAALQHGLAVVGTTAGRSDAVLVASRGLQLVPVGDTGAFAEAVGRLAADEAERRDRGNAARELYFACFDWDVIVEQLRPILRSPG